MPDNFLKRIYALDQAGQPFALATVVRAEKPTSARPGAKAIITADGTLTGWVGGSCAQPTVIREALKALQDGQPRLLRLCPPEKLGAAPQHGVTEVMLTCISGGTLEVYIEPYLPRPHLMVIGHLPVVEALVTLSKGLGYDVTVMSLDSTPDRFSQADRVLNRLDFTQVQMTPQTYVVVASHGNYDEEALAGVLNAGPELPPYVALVASKKRAEALIQVLRQAGLPEERLARIKVPAGLDLGAVTPEEIALSILAEIVQVRRRGQDAYVPLPLVAEGAGLGAGEALDPVCGMTVEVATARYITEYNEQKVYFCSAGCKRAFEKEPERYHRVEV